LTSGTLNIGNSQTNGILNIGTNARSGAINIATVTGSTCGINILNGGGATTGGSVNIANGTLQTTTINIGSGSGGTGTVTIGNASNTTSLGSDSINVNGNLIMGGSKKIQTANLDALTAGGTVELANSNAGAVYIGASGARNVINNIGTGSGTGSINLGNATNVVNVYGTLIMGSDRNITLKTTTTAPTQDTQLGGTRTGSIIGGTIINATTISSITLTTAGVYLITFGIYINVTTLNNINYVQMTGTNTVVNNYGYSMGTTSSQIGYSGCQVVNATASTYTIIMFTNSAFSTGQGGYFTATRIG
jgi:hypothetical protein